MIGKKQEKRNHRIWSRAVVVLLLVSVLASVMPDAVAKRKTSGTFEGTKWNYNTKTKTLTLSCKGKMDDGRAMYLEGWWPWEVWRGEMKRIEVKEGVTYLGYNTAGRCHNVKSVFLPKSLKEIGPDAFSDTKLARIKFPANLKIIGEYAFSDTKLARIKFPANLIIIGDEAFSNTKLKEVVIPPSVKSIYWGAFKSCKQLTKVQLPKNLKEIDGWVFGDCPKLKTITLPSNIKRIGSNLFCKSGLTAITIPKKVTYMGGGAFEECTALKKVTFQTNKLAAIEISTFEGCNRLTAITLPDSITKIGGKAFKGSGLTTVTIPEKVTMIDELAFLNCKSLKEVTFAGSQVTNIRTGAFRNVPADCVFRVPAGQAENIKALLMASGLGDTVTVTEY